MAYDLVVSGQGEKFTDPVAAMQSSYDEGVTDEFVKPHCGEWMPPASLWDSSPRVMPSSSTTSATTAPARFTAVLTQQDMPEQGMKTIPLYYCCLTPYDDKFTGLHILFDKENVPDTIGEGSLQGRTQAAPHRRDRKIRPCDLLLLRRTRGAFRGRVPASSSTLPRWLPTTSSPRCPLPR